MKRGEKERERERKREGERESLTLLYQKFNTHCAESILIFNESV